VYREKVPNKSKTPCSLIAPRSLYEENLLVTLARTVKHVLVTAFSRLMSSRAQLPTTPQERTPGKLTVQRNNTNNEPNAQHHDNERVDLETGALVGVQLQHGRAAATGASGTSA
jgi:hypothetical protein